MIHSAGEKIDIAQATARLDPIDRTQVEIWRKMTPVRRLEIAFQMHQFALEIVRISERRKHPELTPDELNWHVTRRMLGNLNLGKTSKAISS
ncbi:MAG: hypothetical protein R3C14_00105 [Caldilineaceae bacterium]